VKRVRSRLAAGALGVAAVGTVTGGVIAQADEPAPRAHAAQQGGVQITPATVERTARRGTVGSFTVRNTTRSTLRVTVTVRPWTQNRTTAAVQANLRASLSPYVRARPQTFDLSPGSRAVSLSMRRMTASGSLYGGIQVFAKLKRPRRTNGINPQYNVIGRLRLNPTRRRPNLRVGATDVVGRGNNRSLILAVRNVGNTLDPVRGTVRITGPTARNATIPQVSVVPGQVVYLRGGGLRGMRSGSYTATWSITQGTRRYTARRTFRL
jgi:hypothetical protein